VKTDFLEFLEQQKALDLDLEGLEYLLLQY
jgi:hypothetical protein